MQVLIKSRQFSCDLAVFDISSPFDRQNDDLFNTISGSRPDQVLALEDTCVEANAMCSLELKTEIADHKLQLWERKVQDDVENWFTLYNDQTKKYNTAENEDETTATCKNSTLFNYFSKIGVTQTVSCLKSCFTIPF